MSSSDQFVYGNQSRMTYDISDKRRNQYRRSSEESRAAKHLAMNGEGPEPLHPINKPNLDPNRLMPLIERHELRSLSIFSGGGGLDLGFDRAGFVHVASYDIMPVCGETLQLNRPEWKIYSGPDEGNVKYVDWSQYSGLVDVIHGGPPCQPFSIAGQQKGKDDDRNMWGEFVRAIHEIKPKCFVAENVTGLLDPKFSSFVKHEILDPLNDYHIHSFELIAANFGVPQSRKRIFFIGFKSRKDFNTFKKPQYTHNWDEFNRKKKSDGKQFTLFDGLDKIPKTMGVREAIGLPYSGFDTLAPTLRSGFTGKRNTTSILNSKAGEKAWAELGIWGSGVQATRDAAHKFIAKNGNFRLSVQDCGIIQGFPEDWHFAGAVYKVIGQIGNSVAPPVGYAIAKEVYKSLK